MGLGLAKSFIIVFALAVALGWYTKNYWNTVVLILFYAIIKLVWRTLR